MPLAQKLCLWLPVAYIIPGFCALIGSYSLAVRMAIFLGLLTIPLVAIAPPILASRGELAARQYTVAFGVLIMGTLGYLLKTFGVVPRTFFTENAMSIGSALQVTLLSMALGSRLQTLKQKQMKAELEAQHAHTQLIQSEKLAALGAMISGIGHEITNPINCLNLMNANVQSGIQDIRNVLNRIFDGSPEAQEVARKMNHQFDSVVESIGYQDSATKRLTDISMALRAQARDDSQENSAIDVNEVIRESLIIVSGKTGVFEVNDHLGDVPALTGHRSQIGQVVTNLISNAADVLNEKKVSMEKQGETFMGKIEISSHTHKNGDGDEICIVVADNGTGVPADLKEKIFDAFFTTKEVGVGTGLGLSMSAEIIKDHGGQLLVMDDEALGGARFEIHLPPHFEKEISKE